MEVQTERGGPVEIFWVNSGITDVSFTALTLPENSAIVENAAVLYMDEDGKAGFSWKGQAWREIVIQFHSKQPFSAVLHADSQVYSYQYDPLTNTEPVVTLPVSGLLLSVLTKLLVLFSGWVSVAACVFLFLQIDFSRLQQRLGNSRIFSPTPKSLLTLAFLVFGVISLMAVVIGFYNRFYSDDYCYSVLIEKFGYWGAVVDSYQSLNGRFMSHVVNFAALSFGNFSIPLGVPVLLLSVGGSMVWLFSQFFPSEKAHRRVLISVLFSLIVLVFTFLLAVDLYESVYWTLHALILAGGFSLFNLSLALLIRMMQADLPAVKTVVWACIFLVLGCLSAGFHELISAMGMAITGVILLGLLLHHSGLRSNKRVLVLPTAYLVGEIAGSVLVLFGPGQASRFSKLNMNFSLVTAVERFFRLIRENIHTVFWQDNGKGFIIFLFIIFLGYAFGRLIPIRLKWQMEELKPVEKTFLLVFPILLFMICFIPSAFAGGYFPKRTLYVQIYILVSLYFSLFFAFGNIRQAQGNAEQTKGLSWAGILLVLAVFIHAAFYFGKIGVQMKLFAEEWDERAATIQQKIDVGEEDIFVTPYQHSFGTDLSTDENIFLQPCYDGYYGARFHLIDE